MSYKNPKDAKAYATRWYKENKDRILRRGRRHYKRNKKRILKRCKKYYEANRDKIAIRHKRYADAHRAAAKAYRQRCRDKGLCPYCGKKTLRGLITCINHHRAQRLSNDVYRNNLRNEVVMAYGGKCACCGEKNFLFLTVDHPKNDGAKHRRETGCGTGIKFYNWLRLRGYPKDFQILCWNCNCGKRDNGGICPHKVAS